LEKSLTEWITKINQLTTRIKEFKENTETNQTTISDLQKEKEELTSLLNLSETQINNLKD
jgi:chromosome segregation ATPase